MRFRVAACLVMVLAAGGATVTATAAEQTVGQQSSVANPGSGAESLERGADAAGAILRDGHRGSALNVSYVYQRLPEEPGSVEVIMRLSGSTRHRNLSVRPRDFFSVVEASNLVANGSRFEWNGKAPAELVYRLPIDWTYLSNRAASWSLTEHRAPAIQAGSAVRIHEQITIDGTGYVGNGTLLLGAYESYERTVDGERIELVVPSGVDLLYGPTSTVDALADAARTLRIGGRNEVLHAFATPEIETPASFVQPGFALDGNSLLVDADSELDVWTHEYVHTRQRYQETEGLRWLSEGSAEYYGWLLSIQQGYDDWQPLRQALGTDDSILAEPDTWSGDSDYKKGALVMAALDRRIRMATDGNQTMQDVLRGVNAAGADSDLSALLTAVDRVGGSDAAAAARRYLTTRTTPEFQFNSKVYSYDAPQIRSEMVAAAAIGEDWRRPLDTQRRTLRVGLDETLQIETRLTNTGEATGVATVAPRVSRQEGALTRIDTPWVGRLQPGETVTAKATHQFEQPGTYQLTAGSRSFTVTVVPDRATASVTRVAASDSQPDEQVAVDVTVRNNGNSATVLPLSVSLNDTQIKTTATVVDRDTNQTKTVRINSSEPTPYTVSVGNASTTITAQTLRTASETDSSETSMAAVVAVGLGVLVVLVGLAVLVVRTTNSE